MSWCFPLRGATPSRRSETEARCVSVNLIDLWGGGGPLLRHNHPLMMVHTNTASASLSPRLHSPPASHALTLISFIHLYGIWLNWTWDCHKDTIKTGQMGFVRTSVRILMIYEFIGAKLLNWLTNWKATIYASHSHFKYNEHGRAVRGI